MSNKKENYSASIEDPSTGETIEIVGVSEQEIEDQISDLYDYGLDADGVYVGEEAD